MIGSDSHTCSAGALAMLVAMEYVPGKTLDQLIAPSGLKLDDALKYSTQIADAMATSL